jgi:alpha/beta superfamily hydrolase
VARLQTIEIPAPHGALEGLLRLPDMTSPVRMAALVCHPHPLGGGTMHNKVVFRIAQALGDLGFPVLRFNFRGVGRSTGKYDGGNGESEDTRTALDELARRYPQLPLCLAGFSFGSWVGLPVGCADPRVHQLIGVGVPVATLMTDTLPNCLKPKLIVQGGDDQYGPPEKVAAWFESIPAPKRLMVVPQADHFFTEFQTELYQAIQDYFRIGDGALGGFEDE